MILTQFLNDNNLNLSQPNKSRLGHKLSIHFDKEKQYVKEGSYLVIDYPVDFFDNPNTQEFIIETLKTF